MTSKSKKPVDLDDYLPDAATLDRMAEPVIYNKDVDPKLLDRLKTFATNPELKPVVVTPSSVVIEPGSRKLDSDSGSGPMEGEPPRAIAEEDASPATPPALAVIATPPGHPSSASSSRSAPTVQSLPRPVQRRRRELFAALTLFGAIGVLFVVYGLAASTRPDIATARPASPGTDHAAGAPATVAVQTPSAPTAAAEIVTAPVPPTPALSPTAMPSAERVAVPPPSKRPSPPVSARPPSPPPPVAVTSPPATVAPAVTPPVADKPAPAGDKL